MALNPTLAPECTTIIKIGPQPSPRGAGTSISSNDCRLTRANMKRCYKWKHEVKLIYFPVQPHPALSLRHSYLVPRVPVFVTDPL